MKAVVIAPFRDVFGIPHSVGDVIDISDYGMAKYDGFLKKPEQEAKKNGKRKSNASAKAKSADSN